MPPTINLTRDLPKGNVNNLTLSWLTVARVQITAGQCRDSVDDNNIVSAGALTVDLAVSGAGGLDTGAEAANTWYAVWIIGKLDGTVAGLFSLSATAPTMPATYTLKRRLGWARNNAGSDLIRFRQRGVGLTRTIWYDDTLANLIVLAAGSATAFADVDCSALISPGNNMGHFLWGFLAPAVGGATTDLLSLRPNGATSADGPWSFRIGLTLTSEARSIADVPTDNSQIIEYMVTDADDVANIWVLGYDDDLT